MATSRRVWWVVAATLAAAPLCFWQSDRSNQRRLEQAFARTAALAVDLVETRVHSYEYGTRGVRGAVVAAGGIRIRRQDFINYMQTRDLANEFPGALGFGFVRRVPAQGLDGFVAQARADDYPTFAVRELAPHAGDHYVIQYLEPLARNRAAVGVDIASETNRRDAAERAARTGHATLTAPVTLAQASGKPGRGFLLLLPVFTPGSLPGAASEREASLIGWSFAPILIDDVLAGIGPLAEDFSLEIRDPAAPDTPGPFYESLHAVSERSPSVAAGLDIYGRRWELRLTASDEFVSRQGLVSPWVPTALLTGTGLLTALLLSIYLRAGRIEQRSRTDRARLAAILGDSQDGIIGLTVEARITDLNTSARQLLGLGDKQGVGQELFTVLALAGDRDVVARDLASVRAGQPVPVREVTIQATNESPVRVVLSLSPLRGAGRDVTGITLTLRDVSRQRDIEAAFQGVSELTAAYTGEAFLQRAVEALGRLLNARLVYIAQRVEDAPDQAQVLAGWQDGQALAAWRFALAGSPGAYLHDTAAPREARFEGHGDAVVLSRGAVAFDAPRPGLDVGEFIGYPLRDSASRPFGHVAVFHDAPLSLPEQTRQVEVTRLFSQRIEAEMRRVLAEHERGEAEDQLRRLNLTLEAEVEQRTTQLRHTSILQRAIVDGAGMSVITTDPSGLITLFNPAAEALLGRRAADMVGKRTPADFHDPAEVAARAAELSRELGREFAPGFAVFVHGAEQDTTTSREWTYVHANGERIPVLLGIAALRDSDGATLGYLGIGVDMRERRRAEQALRDNEEKLRRLFELSPLGIVLSDLEGRVLEANRAYFDIVGREPGDLASLNPLFLALPDADACPISPQAQLEATGHFGPCEGHWLHASGARVPVRLNGVQLTLGDRQYLWSIVEDITAQREQSDALHSAVERAESATRAKSDFLANMSHEIRTPMNAILGMMQLLMRTSLDGRQRDYVRKSEGAATSLLSILNDILDYSKVEAGMLVLDPRPFAPESLFHDLSVFAEALAVAPGVEVLFDIDPALPALVVGDDLRLKQVLINLLGNAIKFTSAGEIVLSAHAVGTGEGVTWVRLSVRDTGIGIAPENQARIFESFAQEEATTSRRFGGTGLGLAICTRLVSLMHSHLELASEPGKGSEFSFTVSLGTVPGAAASVRLPPPLGHRVLVVDDNPTSLALLAAQCRELGCRVDAVATGEAALALAARAPYDVALVDWRLPGMDGVAVLQQMDALPGNHRPRSLVLVTAADRRAVQERVADQQLAHVGYLFKPLMRSRLEEALSAASAVPDDDAPSMAAPQLDGVRVLVVEDNLVNQQVAQDLLAAEGAVVRLCDGGLQALDLLRQEPRWPQVVLMDVQMPDCDGYEATRRIRGELGLRDVPIIAITANVTAKDRERCLAEGMNDHVGKPFDLDRLCGVIRAWTGQAAAVAGDVAPVAPNGPSSPRFDGGASLQRFGGRKSLLARALRGFVEEAPRLLEGLAGASQPLADRLLALHSLKGLAATVGAGHLAALASAAEVAGRDDALAPDAAALAAIEAELAGAMAWARALADDLDPRSPARARAPESTARRQSLLATLQPLLESSNMASLGAMADVVSAWGSPLPEPLDQLQRQVERFDFRSALDTCLQLQAQLARGEP